jgi:hypothetical protein
VRRAQRLHQAPERVLRIRASESERKKNPP